MVPKRTVLKCHPCESASHPFSNNTYASWAEVPLWKKVATWLLEYLADWCAARLMKLRTYW
jgi:hypothetical protein